METKEDGTLSVKAFFFTISSKSLCVSVWYLTVIVASVVYSLYDEVEKKSIQKNNSKHQDTYVRRVLVLVCLKIKEAQQTYPDK